MVIRFDWGNTMAKAFSDAEKQSIRLKLIESYETCLSKYGIKKISVDDLVKMAGISKGSFYLFYETKEMLFVDVLDYVQDRIKSVIYDTFQSNPGISQKELLKKLIMNVFEQMKKTPWVLDLANSEDYESTLRRIPPEVLSRHMARDSADISEVLTHFHLHLKVSLEVLTALIRALYSTLLYKSMIGEHYEEAVGIMADGIISQIL